MSTKANCWCLSVLHSWSLGHLFRYIIFKFCFIYTGKFDCSCVVICKNHLWMYHYYFIFLNVTFIKIIRNSFFYFPALGWLFILKSLNLLLRNILHKYKLYIECLMRFYIALWGKKPISECSYFLAWYLIFENDDILINKTILM